MANVPSQSVSRLAPKSGSIGGAAGGGGGEAELSLELRSNPLYLSAAREMIAAVTKRLGFPEEAAGQIALAVDEALCNIIRHGYDRDTHRPIWIRVYPEGNGWGKGFAAQAGADAQHPTSLRIVIEDEAQQVDPATIKSRDLAEVRPGGLGVHIIRSVMDEARYERREKVGMRLTMVKIRREPVAANGETGCARAGCGPIVGSAGGGGAGNAGSGAGHG